MSWTWTLPHHSVRQPVLADKVVATSQPLAVQAGLRMLDRGGNAVDAALAAAIALTVVEPTSNGIGGDLLAIVWDGRRLHGLNSSGRAPAGIDVDRLVAAGRMPDRGWDTVTVPGAVAGWVALAERFCRLDLAELSEPAVGYARDGFPVSPVTAEVWGRAPAVFAGVPEFAEAFLPSGRAPRPGERFALPDQAATLEQIAATEGRAFYRGALAERIVAHARAAGAPLAGDDLASHAVEWVDPVGLAVGDMTVWELPPNTQGVAALAALGILAHTPVREEQPGTAAWVHWQAEAMKLAFADAYRHVADPDWMVVRVADLLDDALLRQRAATIDPRRAGDPEPAVRRGGTVYIAAGDGGMLVSLIQSNYAGFGSGIVVPGTGIALHNRGAGFVTDPAHPNAVAPGKRPFHTIIPAFATARARGAALRPLMAFGVMGGPMQPQGHVQVVLRMLAGENPQAALDAPRWRVDGARALALEDGFGAAAADGLAARGHRVTVHPRDGSFGGGQIVAVAPEGGLVGASDPRKDGQASGC